MLAVDHRQFGSRDVVPGKYHREVYLPSSISRLIPRVKLALVYTNHALRASQSDRYGRIALPDQVDLSDPGADIFELTIEKTRGGRPRVSALLARIPYDTLFDVTFVVVLENAIGVVKTVWLNLRDDRHRTLNRAAYVQPCAH